MSHERKQRVRIGAELGVGSAAALAVALIAFHPGPVLRVFPRYGFVTRHLPGHRLDEPDPIDTHIGYGRPARVSVAPIRRAGVVVPNRAIYYVQIREGNRASEYVTRAARLFLLPAVQAQRPRVADWILSYRAGVPGGSRRVYRLDRDLELARMR